MVNATGISEPVTSHFLNSGFDDWKTEFRDVYDDTFGEIDFIFCNDMAETEGRNKSLEKGAKKITGLKESDKRIRREIEEAEITISRVESSGPVTNLWRMNRIVWFYRAVPGLL